MMETSLVVFVGLWAAMVAAMMLPSIVPLASRYARLFDSPHWPSWLSLGAGYLSVWSITGLAAFWLAGWLGGVAMANPLAAKVAAVTIYASAGLYQFTPLKTICLGQCRAPMSLLLQYASWRGVSRHFRVGAHHGLYCLGCCWLLMMLMFALGLMNFGAMLILAIVITVEKVWARGEMFSYAVGAACLALAVAVIWFPRLQLRGDLPLPEARRAEGRALDVRDVRFRVVVANHGWTCRRDRARRFVGRAGGHVQ